jgi:hypothetical protein
MAASKCIDASGCADVPLAEPILESWAELPTSGPRDEHAQRRSIGIHQIEDGPILVAGKRDWMSAYRG